MSMAVVLSKAEVSQYRSHDELSIGYNVINYYLGNLSETTYSYSGAHLPILIIKSLPLILQSHARDLYYNSYEPGSASFLILYYN